MWRLKLLLAVCVAVAASPDADDREERWLSWAEVLGGEPPKAIKPTTSVERSINNYATIQNYENAIGDANIKAYDYEYDNTDNFTDYNYSYDDYDESFFNNDYYEYVDTEDENYIPPPENVTEVTDADPQNAERRTLDFFYHLFNDQFRTDQSTDGRPQRDATTTRRPSLIEAVFRTIDNHIVEDLQEWATYSAQRDAQAVNTEAPPTPSPAQPSIGVPASIQPVSPDNNIVLVTDEQGNQHVVTIDDIVSSLGQLDERTLTNLLLGPTPSASSRSSEIAINAPSSLGIVQSPVIQEQVPVVLGTQKGGQLGIQRPVRHTGPTTTSNAEGDDEVYVVRDEKGEVRLVTINDIISSLAALNDDSLNKLLLEDTAIPAVVAPAKPQKVQTTTPRATTTTTALPIPPAVLPNKESANTSEASTKKPVPKVTYDHNGNLKVLAHPGSVTLDLKDLSWQTEEQQPEETEPEQKPGPVVIDGSTVATDDKGNIHITPDPSKPFTLDIHNILALAEQAETSSNPSKPTRSKSSKTQVKQEEKKEEKEDQPRGYEILSYLAGVEDFLPAAALPKPISSSAQTPGSRVVEDPAGVNSFRSSLLQAIAQQNQVHPTTVPPPVEQPPLLQRLVQPVVQPIVQPFVQAVSQPGQQSSSSGGIGATLSRLLSNFVGQSPTPQTVTVQQPQEISPDPEFIKLVVRQQAPHSDDTHFGEISIPLPQPIHFRPTSKPAQAIVTTTTEAASAADAPSLLRNLPAAIQRSLLQQVNNIPRFVPPGAQSRVATQRSLTPARSRSDTGPIVRTDNHVANAHNSKLSVRSDVRPQRREDIRLPVAQPTNTVPSSPAKKTSLSVSEVLSGLPKSVLESIRKQVQNARIGSSQEDNTKSPQESKLKSSSGRVEEDEAEEKLEPADQGQLERSAYGPPAYGSYGSPVVYGSPGGYGYGHSHGHGYGQSHGYDYGHSESHNPLFDVYFLADLTKVHKVGDTNLSIKSPIIGDPAYFVKTRQDHGYHR